MTPFQSTPGQKMKILAAKIFLIASFALPVSTAHAAGIPVIDSSNLEQTVMSAVEAVAQTLKQIEQYSTQLQQYENQIQNTAAPAAYLWDEAQRTISKLTSAYDTLDYYQNRLGSLDNYLNKFGDVAYYRSSPCYSSSGCTEAERRAMEENRLLASESQKRANDALFRGLALQQKALKDDAKRLEELQTAAQDADGQMKALGYANQFAGQQANQLLQIRGLLMAQQNVIATRLQAQADQEARWQVEHEKAVENRIKPLENPKTWDELFALPKR